MPILIVALICLAIAVLFALWLVYWVRIAEMQSPAGDEKAAPFSAIPISLAFNSDYAILWGTQIPALKFIRARGRRGVPVHRLLDQYHRGACRYPELYDGTDFSHWIRFLESAELIAYNNNRVVLTLEGQAFLDSYAPAEPVTLANKRP